VNLVELKQVDQIAESAVVAAISNRPLKRRMRLPAKTAKTLSRLKIGGEVAGFSADSAQRTAQLARLVKAAFTDWQPGNLNQRGFTNAAIGGKKSKEEAGSTALCPASDRIGRRCGLGSPYSKASTAEDGLPNPECSAAAPGDNVSIDPVSKPRNARPGWGVRFGTNQRVTNEQMANREERRAKSTSRISRDTRCCVERRLAATPAVQTRHVAKRLISQRSRSNIPNILKVAILPGHIRQTK
jgi:hypothetical protein